MRFGFCISGRGMLARLAVRHSRLLGFEPGSVLLDVEASDEAEAELRGFDMKVVRLRGGDRPTVSAQILEYFEQSDDAMWIMTFDRLLPTSIVQPRMGRILNTHMALLPAFRGVDGLGQAVRSSARFAGATIHEIDERMDEGHVVAQFVTEVIPGDSVESLGSRVFAGLAPMYAQTLAWYAQGRVERDGRNYPLIRDAQFTGGPISPALEDAALAFALAEGFRA